MNNEVTYKTNVCIKGLNLLQNFNRERGLKQSLTRISESHQYSAAHCKQKVESLQKQNIINFHKVMETLLNVLQHKNKNNMV